MNLTKKRTWIAAIFLALAPVLGAWGATTQVATSAALTDAVSAASPGDTIQLTADVTLDATLELKKSMTLDLNGKTLSKTLASTTDTTPVIKALSGTVEIANGTITYDLSTYTGTTGTSYANVIYLGMNMSNGVYSYGDCNLTLNGVNASVTFPSGKASMTMVYVESGRLNIVDSNLSATTGSSNTKTQYIIYTTTHNKAQVNAYVSISGTSVISANSMPGIHAIWLQNANDTLIVSGDSVTINADATWKPNSYSTSYGYAINNQSGATCTIEGGKFAGKVWQTKGTITVYGGNFSYEQGTSGQKNKFTLAEGVEYIENTDPATKDDYPYIAVNPYADYVKVADGFYQSGTTYGNSTDFYITNLNGLKFFRDLVNGETAASYTYFTATGVTGTYPTTPAGIKNFHSNNMFNGKTVHLCEDIDLAGEQWITIGFNRAERTITDPDTSASASVSKCTFYGLFDAGIYDGEGNLTGTHVISNLDTSWQYVPEAATLQEKYQLTGLFGQLSGGPTAGVKNLTVRNATVVGRTDVGVIAGRSYNGGAKIENCHVVGNVNVSGTGTYVGGLVGECRASIVNSSVDAATGSSISGLAYVGGLAGSIFEYNANDPVEVSGSAVTNAAVSASYSGAVGVGALVGVTSPNGTYHGNVVISGNDANNVTVTAPNASASSGSVGTLVGYALYDDGAYAILADNTVSGTTSATAGGDAVSAQMGSANDNIAVGANVTLDESGKVTGGIFEEINEELIASGYMTIDNPDSETSTSYPLTIGGPYVATVSDANGTFKSGHGTLAAALAAALDGETVTLISGPDTIIDAKGEVTGGKTITVTGTAKFNWEAGWLFVGRGNNAGDGTLIFKDATITSSSQSTGAGNTGIHISGHEKGSSTKNDGTVIITNSYVECRYLIDKGALKVFGNGTVGARPNLVVLGGFDVCGRPANETESGEDATAYIELSNGAYVQVKNINGLGVGREGKGVVSITGGSKFEHVYANGEFLNLAKGTVSIDATSEFVGQKMGRAGTILVDATGAETEVKIFDLSDTSSLSGSVTVNNLSVDAGVVYGSDGDVTIKPGTFVARVNEAKYETLAEAVAAASAGDTVQLLSDVDVASVVLVGKSITIDGDGHKITTSTANRVIRVTTSNIDVTFKDLEILSTCGTPGSDGDYRGISIDAPMSNLKVTLDNVKLTAPAYAFNVVGGSNLTFVFKDSEIKGWAVINCYASDSTFAITNSTLHGYNDKSLSEWHNFATIIFDGSGSYGTGCNNTVTIHDSKLICESTTSNEEWLVRPQKNGYNNKLVVTGNSSIEKVGGEDGIINFYFEGSDLTSSITVPASMLAGIEDVDNKLRAKTTARTDNGDGTYTIKKFEPVAKIGSLMYESFDAAIAAADAAVAAGEMDPDIMVLDSSAPLTNPDWKISNTGYLVRKVYVAQIVTDAGTTTNKYETLQDAVAAAQAGATIEVIADDEVSLANGQEVTIDKPLTITGAVDEDGIPVYTISGTADQTGYNDIFVASLSGTVTISNLGIDGFGCETANSSNGHAPIFVSSGNNSVVLDNLYISNFNRTGIKINGGEFLVTNCLIDCSTYMENYRIGGVDVANAATGAFVGTTITDVGTSDPTTWVSAALELLGSGAIRVEDCEFTSAINGIFVSTADHTTEGSSAVTVINTTVEADMYALSNDSDAEGAVIAVQSGTFTGLLDTYEDTGLSISGGLFDDEVLEDYCADGYIPTVDEDTRLNTVKLGAYVAAIYDDNDDLVGKYETLADAFAAANATGTATITILDDYTLVGNVGVTVNAGSNITLDLNGHTLSQVGPMAGAGYFIQNKGTLTLKDSTDILKNGTGNGRMTTSSKNPDTGDIPSYANNLITNHGTLTIESGYYKSLTNAGYASFVVDNHSGATANITGGELSNTANYAYVVRMFLNSTTAENALNIGGTAVIEGSYAVWVQYANGNANKASLNISGGTLTATSGYAVYAGGDGYRDASNIDVSFTGGTVNGSGVWLGSDTAFHSLEVSGGTYSAFGASASNAGFITGGTFGSTGLFGQGGRTDPYTVLADGYVLTDNGDGTYGVLQGYYVANVLHGGTIVAKYVSLGDAVSAAQSGDTITLLTNIVDYAGTTLVTKSLTINGAGHSITAAAVPEGGHRDMINAFTGGTSMLKIGDGAVTVTNITFDGHATHAYTYLIEVVNSGASLTVGDISLLNGGELDNSGTAGAGYGAGIHVNNASLVVKDGFYADTHGAPAAEGETIAKTDGVFPFTGILPEGNASVMFDLVEDSDDTPTVDIGEDLLLVGMIGAIDPDTAQVILDYMQVPSRFIPYTLTLGDGSAYAFTGASPRTWNDIIDYGKKIMDVSTSLGYEGLDKEKTPVEVGLLTDTALPGTFVFEDANFTVNGNGNKLTGTIEYTTNAGELKKVVLTSGTILDISAEGATVNFGKGVVFAEGEKVKLVIGELSAGQDLADNVGDLTINDFDLYVHDAQTGNLVPVTSENIADYLPEGYEIDKIVEKDGTTKDLVVVKKQYAISWFNDAGGEIDITTVEHGEVPTHADAVKADSGTTFYTFAGWADTLGGSVLASIPAATADAAYYAVFTEGAYVAQIGTAKYASLAAAFAAAQSGDTIQMIADSAETAGGTVAAGKSVVLDLNGKAVSYTSAFGAAFSLISVNGSLTVDDTSADADGSIAITSTANLSWDYAVNLFLVGNGGSLTIEKGSYSVTTPSYGYAEYVIAASNNSGSSTVTINGGTFTGNNIDAVVRLHDQYGRSQPLNVTVNGGDFTLNGSQCDSVIWFDVQNSGSGTDNASAASLAINGGTFTSTSSSPALDLGHSVDASGLRVTVAGGAFKSNGYVIKTRNLSAAAIANIKLSGGIYSGDEYYDDLTKATAKLDTLCADKYACVANPDTATVASYPWAVVQSAFTVIFQNYDGTGLQTNVVMVGEATPSYAGETPTKHVEGNGIVYLFDGWTASDSAFYAATNALPAIVADETFTAHFTETVSYLDAILWSGAVSPAEGDPKLGVQEVSVQQRTGTALRIHRTADEGDDLRAIGEADDDLRISWSTSDSAIATINGDGLLTFHDLGTVTVTITVTDAFGNARSNSSSVTYRLWPENLRIARLDYENRLLWYDFGTEEQMVAFMPAAAEGGKIVRTVYCTILTATDLTASEWTVVGNSFEWEKNDEGGLGWRSFGPIDTSAARRFWRLVVTLDPLAAGATVSFGSQSTGN